MPIGKKTRWEGKAEVVIVEYGGAGAWFCPTDAEKAARDMKGMVKIASETLDSEREQMRIHRNHPQSNSKAERFYGVVAAGMSLNGSGTSIDS